MQLRILSVGEEKWGLSAFLIQVGSLEDGDLETVPDVLVDTGAAHTMLPGSLLAHHGVRMIGHREFVVADGSSSQYDIGVARIAIPGASEERWPCPVIFGPEDQYLVGGYYPRGFQPDG